MRQKVVFFLYCMILVGLSGCKKSSFRSIDEGEIHYKIILQDRNAVLPDELMPNHMVVKFKDDKILMEITSPIGNNGLFNVIDPDKNQIQTFFRVMGMKYYYMGTADEVPPGIDPLESMEIEFTEQEAELLDMKCKKAIARIPEKDFEYELWYTNEISIKNPNASTPFKPIDGVLINFFFMMGDITVEFEAEGIYIRAVPDKAFEKGQNYRRIDRNSMNELIASMMSL